MNAATVVAAWMSTVRALARISHSSHVAAMNGAPSFVVSRGAWATRLNCGISNVPVFATDGILANYKFQLIDI